jgi:hypothetical protein
MNRATCAEFRANKGGVQDHPLRRREPLEDNS